MAVLDEVLRANEHYVASFGTRSKLAIRPARRVALLTCMDSRLDPVQFAGLAEGDAHIIRNAGGRASEDAIRSFVVSYKLLGTEQFFVVHHTDCGSELLTNESMSELLAASLEPAERRPDGFVDVGVGPGSPAGRLIDWLPIAHREQAVVDDVRTIREHPLIPGRIPIYGFVFDHHTGRLLEVPEATEVGKARTAAG